MQKKILIFFIIYLITGFTINVFAQQGKADRYFEELAYSKAIKYYKKAYKKDIENQLIVKRLAESYRLIQNLDEAEIWYAKLVDFADPDPFDIYYYAQVLKSLRNYEEALIWIEKYYRLTGNEWAKKHLSDMNYHIRLSENLHGCQIINMATNSEEADFGPSFYKDYIIFASSRRSEESTDFVYSWDENPYLELYESEIRDDGELFNTQVLTTNKKSNYHEGPASFSSTENIIYFTRNSWTNSGDTLVENNLKIFKATIEDGEWIDVESLSFNSDDYSCGHPTITSDGNRLYFISNKPDGFGGTDIYYSDKNGDDWSEPVNVGYNINTIGNEMFPFIHENGTLYFASDGHLGLGGLDIFSAYKDSTEVYIVENLGAPINSSRDDFGYIVDKDETKGYFSSNRPGGQGDDDIYWFKREKLKLIGSVKDILDERLLNEVEVILANSEGVKLDSYITTEIGEFEFKIAYNKDYKLLVDKDMIVQVLINLLSNGLKFTARGGLMVKAYPDYFGLTNNHEEEKFIHIEVQDSGIGIKDDDISKLFQTFSQISNKEHPKTEGTGLGLVISKQIMDLHKGKIWVKSVWKKGTTFHILLPAAPVEDSGDSEDS